MNIMLLYLTDLHLRLGKKKKAHELFIPKWFYKPEHQDITSPIEAYKVK